MRPAAAIVLAVLVSFVPVRPIRAADDANVATVGDRKITRAELEEHVRPKLLEIENERYEALHDGLDEMVAEELEKQEAKARGTTVKDLETQEIAAKVSTPTDPEVQKLYDENKSQLGNQTLEQVKPRILEYIHQQKTEERRAAFIGELKKKHKTTI